MVLNWSKYPFLRLVIPLVIGVLLFDAIGVVNHDKISLFIVLLVLLSSEIFLSRALKYHGRWLFGVLTMLVFAYLGYYRCCLQDVTSRREYFGNLSGQCGLYMARVYDPPTEKEKSVKVLMELEGFRNDSLEIKVSGKVIAYFQKSEEALRLEYGDMLFFSSPIEDVPPPLNPEEFDYRKYMERRGVTGRIYLKKGSWENTGFQECNPIFAFAYRFRDRLLEVLRSNGITEEEFGIGAAILLGYDESLPAQVRQNFVAAGAMHILCVSGMHVGIVYLLASFFLGFLGRGKKAAFARKLALLVLIWFYALLTGLSPSVMRSALMISFLIVGELVHRKGFALNSIGASAFVLLLINPNNLFVIGFQLSYVAVIGIVLLQKRIYNLLYIKNKLLDKLWEITAVSIAAQISTMPFTIYYFNQFTPYFWLSNLFMTPLSFLVILAGMLLLMFSWVPMLGVVFGKIVWLMLRLMNGVVSGVKMLPFSLVKGLYMDDYQFGLSLLLLLLFWLFVNLRKKRMMMELLALSAVFSISLAFTSRKALSENRLVFYSLSKHTAIDFVSNGSHVLVCDESLLSDPSLIDYSLKGFWAKQYLTMNPPCFTLNDDFSAESVCKKAWLFSFKGVVAAFWDPVIAVDGCSQRVAVDYLVVREKQRPDLCRVNNSYQVGMLLIDGSVPDYLACEWIRQAEKYGVPYHNLKDGYFECKIYS